MNGRDPVKFGGARTAVGFRAKPLLRVGCRALTINRAPVAAPPIRILPASRLQLLFSIAPRLEAEPAFLDQALFASANRKTHLALEARGAGGRQRYWHRHLQF
jgi:hypothetical protein